jgi:hypothetical protein
LDKLTLVKIIERTAKHDIFNGVGRIIVSDFQNELSEPITAEEILTVWQEFYPYSRIEQRTKNVILIYFFTTEPLERVRKEDWNV